MLPIEILCGRARAAGLVFLAERMISQSFVVAVSSIQLIIMQVAWFICIARSNGSMVDIAW
jgi:steroid 5-alpha reductase family enzyme